MKLLKSPQLHTWRLFSQIQHYDWGSRNQQAYIPRLLGIPIEPDKPYAELWIGDNPQAPSTVVPHGKRGYQLDNPLTLDQLIQNSPIEILGQNSISQFGNQLPFLAKVLSIGDSLSIQVHPNKTQALHLHQTEPEHYPDTNHKPEIAIAIDRCETLAGFRPLNEIEFILSEYPEILNFMNPASSTLVELDSNTFQQLFQQLCNQAQSAPQKLAKAVQTLSNRLNEACLTRKLNTHEQLFLYLSQRYGQEDPGLFILFFLNHIILKPKEALLIPTGMPHAYLQGNLFECMACSNNVVRAGLTPKHKDIKTLVDITEFQFGLPELYKPKLNQSHIEYPVFSPEFSVENVELNDGAGQFFYHPSSAYLIYFLEGYADINYKITEDEITEDYRFSHCVFVPANFPPIEVRAKNDCHFMVCAVPKI